MTNETSFPHAIHGKRTPRSFDRAIAELAERQHGVVARRQLIALGLGRGAIEGRIARGQLHRIHQGAYAVGHRSFTRHARWIAATLSAGPRAVLSHRSAAQLWQLLPPSPIAAELTRPTRFRSRQGLRAHCSLVPSDEIAVVERIRVTSVPRTLMDLAGLGEERQLEKAFNEMQVQGLTDKLSLPALLGRYPNRRGARALRALLAGGKQARGRTRSTLEDQFLALLNGTDLPRPRLNADVAVRGRFFEA